MLKTLEYATVQNGYAVVQNGLTYLSGFGNEFATEALPGALPKGQNSPQRCPYGLYNEQLNGTPFTAPRLLNRRTWLYRIRPSVVHPPFRQTQHPTWKSTPFNEVPPPPTQLRWDPLPIPEEPKDFIEGIITYGGNGDLSMHSGCAVHLYAANRSMERRYFYNADGELLIVPQLGRLRIHTEMGIMEVSPGEIAVIQRGIKFRVVLPDGQARGYICENYGALFRLPDLGPIGANGLANPRFFLTPVAAFEELEEECELIAKFQGNFWATTLDHSPLDVVAWAGNYAPYKYDHLHRAHQPVRATRDGKRGLCHLPRALERCRAHLPPALVPPQLHERVHGAHLRQVRRQGGGLSARRSQSAQLHERARSRYRNL
jgi:homogentisate 1,2-dioxygenase